LRTMYVVGSHDIIYAGGMIGEVRVEIGYVKKDKRAMKEAEELAERIMELYEMIKRR